MKCETHTEWNKYQFAWAFSSFEFIISNDWNLFAEKCDSYFPFYWWIDSKWMFKGKFKPNNWRLVRRDSIHRQPKARALIEKLETIKREAIEWVWKAAKLFIEVKGRHSISIQKDWDILSEDIFQWFLFYHSNLLYGARIKRDARLIGRRNFNAKCQRKTLSLKMLRVLYQMWASYFQK